MFDALSKTEQSQKRLEERFLKTMKPFEHPQGMSMAVLKGETYYYDLPHAYYFVLKYLKHFSLLRSLKRGVDKELREAFHEAEQVARDFPGEPCLIFAKHGSPILMCVAGSPIRCERFLVVDEFQIVELEHYLQQVWEERHGTWA